MQGTLESFRQQWKKEVGLQSEKSSETNENDITQSKDDALDQEKEETLNQSPESDLEKRVGIMAIWKVTPLFYGPYLLMDLISI